ncbi:MAG: hypothetical protein LBP60_02480 [Spirochaetaceae bacterium]|jgi:hypothetical protein|nr:hypothetical protein [Spirochaetaceae bacterium]
MLHKNRVFLVICVLFPALLYSQYLESGDVDIFINNFEAIGEIIGEHTDDETTEWQTYEEIGLEFGESLVNLFESAGQFSDFKMQYRRLIDCTIPGDLENLFRTIGWQNNGHQKFWTLLLGGAFWLAKNDDSLFATGMKDKSQTIDMVLKLFSQQDLHIITESQELQKFLLVLF